MISNKTYSIFCDLYDALCEAVDALIDSGWPDSLVKDIIEFTDSFISLSRAKIPLNNDISDKLIQIKEGVFSGDRESLFSAIKELREKILVFEGLVLTRERLKQENDFSRYVGMLSLAVEDGYTLFITTMDTPCGSAKFTYEIGEKLCGIGVGVNLYNRFRASYCAIIDDGRIEERYSDDYSVSLSTEINGNKIFIDSAGMMKLDCVRHCNVKINDRQVAICKRGLSFVIYDKYNNEVLDSVNFDTYFEGIKVFRGEPLEVVKALISDYPGVVFMEMNWPGFSEENLTENERFIIENRVSFLSMLDIEDFDSPLYTYLDRKEARELLQVPEAYIGTDGARHMEDRTGKYFNSRNGHRITVDQPEKAKRTIYVVGGCNAMGIGARDEGTIASRLQKILNENAPEEGFVVENYGYALANLDWDREIITKIRSLNLCPGDIVLGYGDRSIYADRDYIRDNRYKYGELFFDSNHYTEAAHALMAESVWITLKKNDFYRNRIDIENKSTLKENSSDKHYDYGFSKKEFKELQEYKAVLENLYKGKLEESNDVGAIVMNCNPFTFGHRYLIEEASKRCEKLIVFVVQEDKSVFKFKDRIKLVREGTADLKDVYVMESGKFIISSLTFQEYFNKSEMQDRIVDTSEDVTLFANEIAPAAHIKKRFVGTEPFDSVTRQYNRTMGKVLPRYGVEFFEIPRKKTGEQVISASKVRELLKARDFESLRMFVPDITYDFLVSKVDDFEPIK